MSKISEKCSDNSRSECQLLWANFKPYPNFNKRLVFVETVCSKVITPFVSGKKQNQTLYFLMFQDKCVAQTVRGWRHLHHIQSATHPMFWMKYAAYVLTFVTVRYQATGSITPIRNLALESPSIYKSHIDASVSSPLKTDVDCVHWSPFFSQEIWHFEAFVCLRRAGRSAMVARVV